jgi:gluconokinase
MDHTQPVPLVVMGVSGSGKTTVGEAIGARLGVPTADADAFHPQANIDKMASGQALDDDDRQPWLEAIGDWLHEHADTGCVVGCSALKRKYRDLLRGREPRTEFLHLHGSRAVITARQAARKGHFMPPSLLQSQFDTLQPLEDDEAGVVVDVDQSVRGIVEDYLRSDGIGQRSGTNR